METSLIIPPLFCDGCVLQRGESTRFWGWFVKGGKVSVSMGDCQRETTAAEDGSFFVTLSLEAGGPRQLFVSATDPASGRTESVTMVDVFVGDVFLCAGQSNMELPIERVREKFPEVAGNTNLRECKIVEDTCFKGPQKIHRQVIWKTAENKELEEMSAVGYFFGDFWQQDEKIPVGFINASKGGSPIEAWLPEEDLRDDEERLQEAARFRLPGVPEAFLIEQEQMEEAWQREILAAEKENEDRIKNLSRKEMELPGFFSDLDQQLVDFCGCLYLEKEFVLEKEQVSGDVLLKLGTLTDSDRVYVNGVFAGETTYCYPPRRYRIPEGVLQEGKNTISVRLLCRNGGGRFTPGKPYGLYNDTGRFLDLSGPWQYKIAAYTSPAPVTDFLCRKATGLYNAMIHPLSGMTLKGIVWYQGESNGRNPLVYEKYLKRLIHTYRKLFLNPELPFVVVQLPACGMDIDSGEAWPLIRNAQLMAGELPAVAVTVNLDLGERNDLHPLDKRGIGYRAFLAIKGLLDRDSRTGHVFGPRFLSYKAKGDVIHLLFDRGDWKKEITPATERDGFSEVTSEGLLTSDGFMTNEGFTASDGLTTNDGRLCREFFVILKNGGRIEALPAKPNGDSISLIFPGLEEAAQKSGARLYYAWHAAPLSGLLCNNAGLLLSPFFVDIDIERYKNM